MKVLVTQSCPTFVTPWTVACQAPLSMGFSRQEYWNGLPFPPAGDLPDPGVEPVSPTLEADFFFFKPSSEPIEDKLPPLTDKLINFGLASVVEPISPALLPLRT